MSRLSQRRHRRLAGFPYPPALVQVLAALFALALAAGPDASRAAAMSYAITDLGGTDSNAQAINNRGQVVGQARIPGGWHAFLWDSTGMHDLGDLGFPASDAIAINDLGQVVGNSNTTGNVANHAFLWDGTGMHDLGTLGGGDGTALDINSSGQIVGVAAASYSGSIGRDHPFLFSDGVMHDLGRPPDLDYPTDQNTFGGALAINASGKVLVKFERYGTTPQSRVYLWQDGVWQHLKALDNMAVSRLNDAGQIAGGTSMGYGTAPGHAFVYDSGGLHDLGTLGGANSSAVALNNTGQVVGYSDANGPPPVHPFLFLRGVLDHPFLYSGGVMSDLTDLLLSTPKWERFIPSGINDLGQIVGEGYWAVGTSDSGSGAFLLTPTPAPLLRTSTGALDFGSQPVGVRSPAQTITLNNRGELPLTVDSLAFSGPDATSFAIASDTGETTIAPGASRTIRITLTPAAGRSHTATLTIHHNDQRPTSPHTVTLSGTGIEPAPSLDASSVNFGNQRVGTTSDGRIVTLTNTGPAPLVVRSISVTGDNANEFSTTDLAGMSIGSGESRTIRLHFTPTARGSRSATLTINDNAPVGGRQTLALAGTGTAPVVSISPTRLEFGSQPVGSGNDGSQGLVLQNTGDAPLTISAVTLAGSQPGDFRITADGWTGVQLLPTQIAALNVRFTPMAVGNRSASLSITDDAISGPQSVPLSGQGTAPAISLSAGSLTFGAQLVGTTSSEQTVAIINGGTSALTINSLSLAGDCPRDFVIPGDLTGATIAPGQSRSVSVRFAPTAAGSRSAVLTISDSAAGSPHLVTLSGMGTSPSLSFGVSQLGSPKSVSFGSQALGAGSATQTITLTNSGNAPLTISGIALTGAQTGDFAITQGGGKGTLAPGASRSLTIRFTPMALGSRAAGITIRSNAPGNPLTITLGGTGIMPTGGPPGSGGAAALVPTKAELFLTAIDSTPASGKQATVSVGQSVTVRLRLKFRNGAVAETGDDPLVRFFTDPVGGRFTARNVWQAGPENAGKKITVYGRYYSPYGRQPILDKVTITVRRVQNGRH